MTSKNSETRSGNQEAAEHDSGDRCFPSKDHGSFSPQFWSRLVIVVVLVMFVPIESENRQMFIEQLDATNLFATPNADGL